MKYSITKIIIFLLLNSQAIIGALDNINPDESLTKFSNTKLLVWKNDIKRIKLLLNYKFKVVHSHFSWSDYLQNFWNDILNNNLKITKLIEDHLSLSKRKDKSQWLIFPALIENKSENIDPNSTNDDIKADFFLLIYDLIECKVLYRGETIILKISSNPKEHLEEKEVEKTIREFIKISFNIMEKKYMKEISVKFKKELKKYYKESERYQSLTKELIKQEFTKTFYLEKSHQMLKAEDKIFVIDLNNNEYIPIIENYESRKEEWENTVEKLQTKLKTKYEEIRKLQRKRDLERIKELQQIKELKDKIRIQEKKLSQLKSEKTNKTRKASPSYDNFIKLHQILLNIENRMEYL